MKIDERRRQILAVIQSGGNMRVSQVIECTGFSPATVRRDIAFLQNNGIVTHSHGYVQYVKPTVVPTEEFSDGVLRIAAAAAELVEPQDTFIMDSGSTTFAMAYQIAEKTDITVITNSVPIVSLFSSSENIQTYMTGGFLRAREAALVGEDTVAFINGIHAKKLFLSTTGIRGSEGLTCVTPFQADVKRAFIRAADKVILLADASKFKRDGLRVFATFDQIDTIVTDEPISSGAVRQRLEQLNVEIIVAK